MSYMTGTATDFLNLIDIIDGFLTDAGHAFGLAYSGDGNGELTGWSGGVDSVAETFTITMLSATDFDVVGSVSGSIGYGTVGVTFSDTKLEFDITEGSQPFIAGDFWTISTSPAWTQKRRDLLTEFNANQGITGSKSFHGLNDGIIDRDGGDDHYELASPSFPVEVVFAHEVPLQVVEYAIAVPSTALAPTDWTLDYYEESSSSWITADTQASVTWTAADTYQVFALAAAKTALRWRLNITNGGAEIRINQVALRTANGGINRIEECVAWEAPGDDGVRSFLCGIKPLVRQDLDYWTLELFLADAWAAGSELIDQANIARNCYCPLWNDPIDYWLVARGNGVRGVFKIGTQYETFSLGHIDAYFPPNEYPAPLLLGGSLVPLASNQDYRGARDGSDMRFSETNRNHSAYPIAGLESIDFSAITQRNQQRMSCRVRLFDGSYRGFYANYSGDFDAHDILESGTPPVQPGNILPYLGGFGSVGLGLTGAPVLYDIVLATTTDVLGELPGVKAVSGDNVSAETVIAAGPIDYIVFPNITRTGLNEFYALALD